MKRMVICFVFFSSSSFSQSYLNVLLSDGSYKYSGLGSLQKITLSAAGDQLYFHLSDGTVPAENTGDVKRMTIDAFPMGAVLPVELSSCAVSAAGRSVLLTWRTESEVHNYGFEIERASAAPVPVWADIGFVKGRGNSNVPQEYSFTDSPLREGGYLYRIKQIDSDGKYHSYRIMEVQIGASGQFALHQNYPNPFNPVTRITYSLPADGFVTAKVFDALGREISLLVHEHQKAGTYTTAFDGSRYVSGMYICRINSGVHHSSIKMTLMK